MSPAPSLIAGTLIGMFASPWPGVVAYCALWGLVCCLYLYFCTSTRRATRTVATEGRAGKLIFRSPALAFWLVEWMTGFVTSLACATVAYYLPVVGWATN
jgi:hypothetical protein